MQTVFIALDAGMLHLFTINSHISAPFNASLVNNEEFMRVIADQNIFKYLNTNTIKRTLAVYKVSISPTFLIFDLITNEERRKIRNLEGLIELAPKILSIDPKYALAMPQIQEYNHVQDKFLTCISLVNEYLLRNGSSRKEEIINYLHKFPTLVTRKDIDPIFREICNDRMYRMEDNLLTFNV